MLFLKKSHKEAAKSLADCDFKASSLKIKAGVSIP